MGRKGGCGGADMTGAESRLEGKCWFVPRYLFVDVIFG
jgi:hypothetical protein